MRETKERPVRIRARADPAAVAALKAFDPVLAGLYAARGITAASELDLALQRLAPIGSLNGVDRAVEVLMAFRQRRVVVVGDFDVDGATSTALVVRCLRDFGFADVDYLVPNRFEYGYGLTPEIVRTALQSSPALLVTVDNGISSLEGVAEAQKYGIEVLITDHHLPGSVLPAAAAIVNPNLAGSTFASRHLAGVGVAFYVMAALGNALQRQGRVDAARVPARYLDLVALGTVADVVRLDQNNRILVTQGLRRIRAGSCVAGIAALLAASARPRERASSTDLGFAVAPRLNAAGRLEDMSVGIECLLTDDSAVALSYAGILDGINRERREIEASMRDQAFSFVDRMDEAGLPACVCVYETSWHPGVAYPGALPSPRHCICTGSGRPAERIGALGAGNSHSRSPGSRIDGSAGPGAGLRRTRNGCRFEHCLLESEGVRKSRLRAAVEVVPAGRLQWRPGQRRRPSCRLHEPRVRENPA
jgi:single-stranded-DNA-specific exonuclease